MVSHGSKTEQIFWLLLEEGIMTISLKLTESNNAIADKINVAIASHVNSIIKSRQSKLKAQIQEYIGIWIRSQPEMLSLGLDSKDPNSLSGHFGLPYGTSPSVVSAIVSSVKSATRVGMKKLDKRLRGGVTFYFQPSHFANLLGLSQGHVTTEKGTDLHWMDWILKSGNKIIVVGYEYSPESGFGRSRNGVMSKGTSWRVPPEFAGTEADNFITRAFSNKERELTALFRRMIEG